MQYHPHHLNNQSWSAIPTTTPLTESNSYHPSSINMNMPKTPKQQQQQKQVYANNNINGDLIQSQTKPISTAYSRYANPNANLNKNDNPYGAGYPSHPAHGYGYSQFDLETISPSFNPNNDDNQFQDRFGASKRSGTPDIERMNHRSGMPTSMLSNNNIMNVLNKADEALQKSAQVSAYNGGAGGIGANSRSMTPKNVHYPQSKSNLTFTPTSAKNRIDYPKYSPNRAYISPSNPINYHQQQQNYFPQYNDIPSHHYNPMPLQQQQQPYNMVPQSVELFTQSLREVHSSIDVINKADEALQKSSMLRSKISSSSYQALDRVDNKPSPYSKNKIHQVNTPKYQKESSSISGGKGPDAKPNIVDLINKAEEALKKSSPGRSANKVKDPNFGLNLILDSPQAADRNLSPNKASNNDARMGFSASNGTRDPKKEQGEALNDQTQRLQQSPTSRHPASPIIQETKDLINRADKALNNASQTVNLVMRKDHSPTHAKYMVDNSRKGRSEKKFGSPKRHNEQINSGASDQNKSPFKGLGSQQVISPKGLKDLREPEFQLPEKAGVAENNEGNKANNAKAANKNSPIKNASTSTNAYASVDALYEDAIKRSLEIQRKNDDMKRGKELRDQKIKTLDNGGDSGLKDVLSPKYDENLDNKKQGDFTESKVLSVSNPKDKEPNFFNSLNEAAKPEPESQNYNSPTKNDTASKKDSPKRVYFKDDDLKAMPYREPLMMKPERDSYLAEDQYSSGFRYFGEKMNDYKHGRGQCYYPDNTYYEGDWEYDKRYGYGIFYDKNGNTIYDGEWVDDKYQGNGILYNTKQDATRSNQNIDHRDLVQIGNRWYKYEGEFLNGMKHGFGTLYLSNGDRFSGKFRNDLAHGAGTYYYKNDNIVKGNWQNNQMSHNL